MLANLLELLEHATADATAVFYEHDGVAVTYGEFRERVARTAAGLAVAGVRRGDRVAMQLEKGQACLDLYGATIHLGAVLLPMNPGYTAEETAYILGDAEPALVIDDPGIAIELMRGDAPEVAPSPRGPDELAAVLYTSGTTGRPKGALLRDGSLVANAEALRDVWQFVTEDCFVHALPLYHAHGLFITLNCVLASGCRMRLLDRFEVAPVIAALRGATVFSGVPTYYTRLLEDPAFDEAAVESVRLFISGSAPMLPATHDEFARRTGKAVHERYGTTETQVLTAHRLGAARPGTVGPPLAGYDVRVTPMPDEATVGYVEARIPGGSVGYWQRDSAGDFTSDGFFRTGDIGAFAPDGHLVLSGRSKDLIISGGLNVYPVEVERVLDRLEGVEESAVVAAPDADLGETVVAFVVPRPGCAIDPAALRAAARQELAGYKTPKRVLVVDSLPRNALGKVEKARLRASLS